MTTKKKGPLPIPTDLGMRTIVGIAESDGLRENTRYVVLHKECLHTTVIKHSSVMRIIQKNDLHRGGICRSCLTTDQMLIKLGKKVRAENKKRLDGRRNRMNTQQMMDKAASKRRKEIAEQHQMMSVGTKKITMKQNRRIF